MKTNTSTQLLTTEAVSSLFPNPRTTKPQVCLQGVSVHYLRGPAPPTCTASCTCVTSRKCPEEEPPGALPPRRQRGLPPVLTLCALKSLEPPLSFHCTEYRCFSSSLGFKMFSKNRIAKELLFSYVGEVRNIKATEMGFWWLFLSRF